MIKIGLLGEDPNDTSSIKNLLIRKYAGKVQFYSLCNRITGYQLDNPKVKRSLPIEFKDKDCDFILYIRDLDGFKSETSKIQSRQKWFKDLDKTVNGDGLLLLNIWELESLILADIESFNKIYGTKHQFSGDPMTVKEPKEELKRITFKNRKQYRESSCPVIFSQLDFDVIQKTCSYFKEFASKFEEKIEFQS